MPHRAVQSKKPIGGDGHGAPHAEEEFRGQLALRRAGSGKVQKLEGIRDGLVENGYRRAPALLDSNKIRMILDIHCVDSGKSEKVPGEPDLYRAAAR